MTYRPASVALVWLLVLAFGCSSPASPTGVEEAGSVAPAASEMAVLTNEERAQAGLTPFKTSQPLMQAAMPTRWRQPARWLM
jgi:hypothetical protein